MLVKVVVVGDKSVGKSSLIKSFINTNENDVVSVEDVISSVCLSRYLNNFVKAGYDSMDAVVELNDNDLKQMGIKIDGHRVRLLKAIKQYNGNKSDHTTTVKIQHTQFVIQFSEKAGWEKEEQEPKQPDLQNGFNLYRYNTENEINAQVIVYDVTNEQSFDFINKWIYGNRTDAPTILIANKCDAFPNNIDGKEEILSYGYCRDYVMYQIILMCAKYYGQKQTGQQYAKQNNMVYFEVSTMHNHINAVFKCISELALAHKELSNYRADFDMLRERAGSFKPTLWTPGWYVSSINGGMYTMSGMASGGMYPMNGPPMSQIHGMNSAANNIHEQQKQYFKHLEEQRVQFEKRYSSMSSAIPPVIPTPPKQTIEINENSNNSWTPFVLFFGIIKNSIRTRIKKIISSVFCTLIFLLMI
eukprot:58804_1